MNKQYKFHWKRRFFWKSKTVIGHSFTADQDKMVLYYPNGEVQEIAKWSKCEVYLGVDWVLAVKKNMEKEAGQAISLAVG